MANPVQYNWEEILKNDYRNKISKEDLQHYSNMTEEELEIILQGALNSEFWKWFRVRLYQTLYSAELNGRNRSIQGFDDVLVKAKWDTIFKNTEEIFNMPEFLLSAIKKNKLLREKTTK